MNDDTNLMTWREFAVDVARDLAAGVGLGIGAYAGWAACRWLFGG